MAEQEPPPCSCEFGSRLEVSPDTEVARGAYTLESMKIFRDECYTEWRVACTRCGRRYLVVDDNGYWKTLYNWSRA